MLPPVPLHHEEVEGGGPSQQDEADHRLDAGQKAEIVGQNGRKLAQIEFDYTNQVDRIISFFDELQENKKQIAPSVIY